MGVLVAALLPLKSMKTQTLDGAEMLEIAGDENSMSGLRGCSNERIDHVGLVATSDLCSQTSYSRSNCQGRHEGEKASDLSKLGGAEMRGREKLILRDDRDACSDAPCFDIKKKLPCGGIPTEVIDKNIGVNKVSHDLRWVAERAQRRRIRRVYVVPRGNPLPSSPAVARTTLGIMRPSRRGAATLGEVSFNASNLSSTASTSSIQMPGRRGLIIAEEVYHAVGGISSQTAKSANAVGARPNRWARGPNGSRRTRRNLVGVLVAPSAEKILLDPKTDENGPEQNYKR